MRAVLDDLFVVNDGCDSRDGTNMPLSSTLEKSESFDEERALECAGVVDVESSPTARELSRSASPFSRKTVESPPSPINSSPPSNFACSLSESIAARSVPAAWIESSRRLSCIFQRSNTLEPMEHERPASVDVVPFVDLKNEGAKSVFAAVSDAPATFKETTVCSCLVGPVESSSSINGAAIGETDIHLEVQLFPKPAQPLDNSISIPLSPTKPSTTITKKQHLRRWGHGRLWTSLALVFAWAACVCALLSRQSLRFVDFKHPLDIAPLFEPVKAMGVIRVQICRKKSKSGMRWCEIIPLGREKVNDKFINLSGSLLTMGASLGVALTVVLSTSIVWETINLRPVGFGFLLVYFFQSFSLIFFDANICNESKCRMAPGSILCVMASIFWIAACFGVAKMDAYKVRSIRARRRAARKLARQARREKRERKLARKQLRRIDDSAASEETAELSDIEQGSSADIASTMLRIEGETNLA